MSALTERVAREHQRIFNAKHGILCRFGLHSWPSFVVAHWQAPAPIHCHRCRKART